MENGNTKPVNEDHLHYSPELLQRCKDYPAWAAERIVQLMQEKYEHMIELNELRRDMATISGHVLDAKANSDKD